MFLSAGTEVKTPLKSRFNFLRTISFHLLLAFFFNQRNLHFMQTKHVSSWERINTDSPSTVMDACGWKVNVSLSQWKQTNVIHSHHTDNTLSTSWLPAPVAAGGTGVLCECSSKDLHSSFSLNKLLSLCCIWKGFCLFRISWSGSMKSILGCKRGHCCLILFDSLPPKWCHISRGSTYQRHLIYYCSSKVPENLSICKNLQSDNTDNSLSHSCHICCPSHTHFNSATEIMHILFWELIICVLTSSCRTTSDVAGLVSDKNTPLHRPSKLEVLGGSTHCKSYERLFKAQVWQCVKGAVREERWTVPVQLPFNDYAITQLLIRTDLRGLGPETWTGLFDLVNPFKVDVSVPICHFSLFCLLFFCCFF